MINPTYQVVHFASGYAIERSDGAALTLSEVRRAVELLNSSQDVATIIPDLESVHAIGVLMSNRRLDVPLGPIIGAALAALASAIIELRGQR